jgi:hypothetical protein
MKTQLRSTDAKTHNFFYFLLSLSFASNLLAWDCGVVVLLGARFFRAINQQIFEQTTGRTSKPRLLRIFVLIYLDGCM